MKNSYACGTAVHVSRRSFLQGATAGSLSALGFGGMVRADGARELAAQQKRVVVFWLAHVWSEIVSHRVHGPIEGHQVRSIAMAEIPMLEATVLPALALAAARLPGVTADAAISLALVVCIGQLFVWGLVVGRAAHSSRWLALRVAIIDSLLGVAIVGLKVVVIH
jgi:hypothetical protein